MEEKIDIKTLEHEVEGLYSKHLVARITFRGVTPWWGGDYEGRTSRWVDEDEIAGRLRWFLRTVYNRFCANNLNDYSESEKWVSQLLGSTSGRSIYLFRTRIPISSLGEQEKGNYRNLERVKLFTQGKHEIDELLPIDVEQLVVEVLRTHEDKTYDGLIVGGLLITLAFLGVGKGANRGFGRFVPEKCEDLNSEVCKYVMEGKVREAFESLYSLFKGITGCNKMNSWKDSAVPLAPLTNDGPDSIKETHCTTSDVITVLNVIQRSVIKSTFKKVSYGIKIGDPGPFIHTWVFGLPRHSKVPEKIKRKIKKMEVDVGRAKIDKNKVKESPLMGYLELKGDQLAEPRRQSMFVISPVLDGSECKIYVIPFLSLKDNEDEVKVLVHKGIHDNANKIHLAPVLDILNNQSLYNSEEPLAKKRKKLSYGSVEEIIKNYGSELVKVIDKTCQDAHGTSGHGGDLNGAKRPTCRH